MWNERQPEKQSRDMSGIVEHRFNPLQEVEAILEFPNTEMRKLRAKTFREVFGKLQ